MRTLKAGTIVEFVGNKTITTALNGEKFSIKEYASHGLYQANSLKDGIRVWMAREDIKVISKQRKKNV